MAYHRFHYYSMLKRSGRIIEVLRKYGFGYIVDQMGLSTYGDVRAWFGRKSRKEKIHVSKPARTRMVLEELGTTYIKLGQLLSMREDLIPEEYALELSKLQDEVPPFEYEEVKRIIEEEFRVPIEDLFDFFEEKPLAAASIGQVHRAKIKNGQAVVVKVQRPGIKEVIESDLEIMYSIAGFAEEHIPELRLYRPLEIVDELSRSIHAEMDYTQEGRNTDHFATNFGENRGIFIPKVYWDHTSTRVLTLEYIEGVKSSCLDLLDEKGFDRSKIAHTVGNAFMQQVFEDGFFHADLHPGNMLIKDDGKIALIDFGLVGHLSAEIRNMLIDELIAITKGDIDLFVEILQDMGYIGDHVDITSLKADVEYFRAKYYGRPLKDLDTHAIIEELTGILRKHQVQIPSNLALLAKAVLTVEGFGRMMDPDFNISELGESYGKKILKQRLSPQNLAQNTYSHVLDWSRVFRKAPTKISHILDVAEKGYLKLKIEPESANRISADINAASNRLSLSLMISAVIIGSSMIIQTNMKPYLWGVPLLGVFGFLVAGLFGLWLIIYIVRTGQI
jgi:ubiquinone biosynthesis protein